MYNTFISHSINKLLTLKAKLEIRHANPLATTKSKEEIRMEKMKEKKERRARLREEKMKRREETKRGKEDQAKLKMVLQKLSRTKSKDNPAGGSSSQGAQTDATAKSSSANSSAEELDSFKNISVMSDIEDDSDDNDSDFEDDEEEEEQGMGERRGSANAHTILPALLNLPPPEDMYANEQFHALL